MSGERRLGLLTNAWVGVTYIWIRRAKHLSTRLPVIKGTVEKVLTEIESLLWLTNLQERIREVA